MHSSAVGFAVDLDWPLPNTPVNTPNSVIKVTELPSSLYLRIIDSRELAVSPKILLYGSLMQPNQPLRNTKFIRGPQETTILFHSETPEADTFLRVLQGYRLTVFADWKEVEKAKGLVIARAAGSDDVPLETLRRCLFVVHSNEAAYLRDYFRAGLRDAMLAPPDEGFLLAKVEQLTEQVRSLEVQLAIDEIQEMLDGKLSPKEIEIVRILMLSGENGVSRVDFFEAIWPGVSVLHKTLDTHLFNLRAKLERIEMTINWERRGQSWRLRSRNPRLKFEA